MHETPGTELRGKKRFRLIWRLALFFVFLLGICLWFWITPNGLPLFGNPHAYWETRHGNLVGISEERREDEGSYRLDHVHVTSNSGLWVDLAIKRPLAPEPRPTVIILGGHRTGRQAVHLLEETEQTNIVALDYPFKGNHRMKGFQVFRALPQIRQGLYDCPPSIWLTLDYLLQQPYVDPEKIELVGVSLGAPLVVPSGALDKRISRVWAIEGGGDLYTLFNHNLQTKISLGPLRSCAASVAQLLLHTIAPENWVSGIGPRPFVMINADQDERIPKICVEALYASAGEPKELIWIPDNHVDPKRPDAIAVIFRLVMERVDPERANPDVP